MHGDWRHEPLSPAALRRVGLWIVGPLLVVLLVWPVVYFTQPLHDRQFQDGTMGNRFATMVGVIAGIPVALALSRWQQQERDRKEREARQADAVERKRKTLGLIRQELVFNQDALHKRARYPSRGGMTPSHSPPRRVVLVDLPLKDELWQAISDGGELQWVDDLPLLDAISGAYYYVRAIASLEDRYLDIVGASQPVPRGAPENWDPGVHILEFLTGVDATAREAIGRALTSIASHLPPAAATREAAAASS
jgi:hypothetical protein